MRSRDEIIGAIIDQVRCDMKRGNIGILSIEDVLDVAEATLTDEEYEHFTAEREYLIVYQSA